MFCFIGLENTKQTAPETTGTKPRYKQSYRKAWESMRDFKGWLSSVPGNTSKAYCKLCQKELHCHRLSLLKHKVTFKHQKKEEEQELSGLRADMIVSCQQPTDDDCDLNKEKISEAEHSEENNSTNDSVDFEMDENDSNLEDVVLTKPTTSEPLLQEKQENVIEGKGSLSTHVLDTSRGVPGALVHLVLYKLIEGRWTLIQEGITDTDGRFSFFKTTDNSVEFSKGRYKLHYDVDKYFEKLNQETIFPFIEIVFDIKDKSTSYHIPLLLSPYGYSTYRGS